MPRFSGGMFTTSRPKRRIAPVGGFLESRDGAQQRGLSAAGRAQDGDELAGRDRQVDPMQHALVAIAHVKAIDFDSRGLRFHPRS